MNQTSIEHFRQYFPQADIARFDKIYFTKVSDDDFAFICVQGSMEDFKVFIKGTVNEETLEKRVFMLVKKYSSYSFADSPSIADDNSFDQTMVRDELFKKDIKILPGISALLVVIPLSILQGLALGFVYYMSLQLIPVLGLAAFLVL